MLGTGKCLCCRSGRFSKPLRSPATLLLEKLLQNAFRERLDYGHKEVFEMSDVLDTSQIKNWRSIVTLVVFVFTSKCSICLGRLYPMQLTLSLSHRYYCAFSLSYSGPHPSTSLECCRRHLELLASNIATTPPLSVWLRRCR